ncbi:zf-TFIIB domain-containing protein, partial [Parapedobacter sp. 10938]|uniref:TFIIB-type zinc ribbon-containing protein n=1 Tax=Parapedobacter flavus TaxID=3110225 RepID=UPI002DC04854
SIDRKHRPHISEIDTLLMSVRNQVEIDYCPKCRGIWLDRGELDKIIEQSEKEYPQTTGNRDPYPDRRYQERGDDRHGGYRKKKKSFLGDFFDFD